MQEKYDDNMMYQNDYNVYKSLYYFLFSLFCLGKAFLSPASHVYWMC